MICANETINIIVKLLSIIGLSLDIVGVFKLFSFEPPPLEDSDSVVFENCFPPYPKIEEIENMIKNINRNIFNLKNDTKELQVQSKKWFLFIIIGFVFQFLSVLISFFL